MVPIVPTPLRPLTIDWYLDIPLAGGRHVDGLSHPSFVVRHALEPVVLLDPGGDRITADVQAARLARSRAALRVARKDPSVRTAVLGLGFSGFPGWDNFDCWNWWLPDIETRSLDDVRAAQHDAALLYVRAGIAWAAARLGPIATIAHCAFHQHECVPHGHLVVVCVEPYTKGLRVQPSILASLAAVEPGGTSAPSISRTATGRARPLKAVVRDSFFESVAALHGFLGGTYEARFAWLETRLQDLETKCLPGADVPPGHACLTRTVQRELDRIIHCLGGPRRSWFWLKQWEERVSGKRKPSV